MKSLYAKVLLWAWLMLLPVSVYGQDVFFEIGPSNEPMYVQGHVIYKFMIHNYFPFETHGQEVTELKIETNHGLIEVDQEIITGSSATQFFSGYLNLDIGGINTDVDEDDIEEFIITGAMAKIDGKLYDLSDNIGVRDFKPIPVRLGKKNPTATEVLTAAETAPDNLDRITRQDAIDQTVSMLQQIAIAEVALNVESSSYAYTVGGDAGPSEQLQESIRAIEALAQYGFRPDPYVVFTILPLNRGNAVGFLAIAGHKKIGSPIYVYDGTAKDGVVAYNEYKRRNPNLKLDHFALKTYIYENGRVKVGEERNIAPQ